MKKTDSVIAQLIKSSPRTRTISISSAVAGYPEYSVVVRSGFVASLLQSKYSFSELSILRKKLSGVTDISVDERGLVKAADRIFEGKKDPTHYDAIWLRDSLWAYLGLRSVSGREIDAKRVLKAMLEYVSTPAQQARLRSGAPVHIRFDGSSPSFADVRVGGKPQPWNHKQNDALGLFFDLALRSVEDGFLDSADITSRQVESLALFPSYFAKVKFFEMEDSGAWEEIERVNTSSVALVTSALETLLRIMKSREKECSDLTVRIHEAARAFGVGRYLGRSRLERQIHRGYTRVVRQLRAGGESPFYPVDDPRYRMADAALLNVVYPATLRGLSLQDKERALKALDPLMGRVGIRRYRGDSYQSGNFWLKPFSMAGGVSGLTEATRSAREYVARNRGFVRDSEAQWFFDSWYSIAAGKLFQQTGNGEYYFRQIKFFNRALAQITGDGAPFGADGKRVPARALPESYNSVISGDLQVFAPSPICPLNWAKASLLLALSELERTVH